MTTATLTESNPVRCQNCPSTYRKPARPEKTSKSAGLWDGMPVEDCARAIGWRVWSGKTMGGQDVHRVFCPRCVGDQTAVDETAEPKWDARCNSCDWAASDEDEYGDEPFSEADAKRWKDDHRCEPDVEIIRPKKVAA